MHSVPILERYGLNKVLMNASLIAFPVNDLSLEILKYLKITMC